MAEESKQASSAKTALIYLTTGALLDVWTAIYYLYQARHTGSEAAQYWCAGFFSTGMVLIGIGLAIGRIGRSARSAEVAPTPDVVVSPTNVAPAAPAMTVPANGVVMSTPTPVAMAQTAPEVAPVGR